MDLTLTDEQRALQDTLRDVFGRLCPPSLVRDLKRSEVDGLPAGLTELWDALTKTGVPGLVTGQNHDSSLLYELGLAFYEGGRVLCPTVVYSTLIFGVALNRLGTAAQRAEYLARLTSGELRASIALWNPSNAGDLEPTVGAERVSGGWSLTGTLMFVPDAALADVMLVSASVSDGSATGQIGVFLVEPGRAGWSVKKLSTIAGDNQARVDLDGYVVADEAQIGAGDDPAKSLADRQWVANAAIALQCMEMSGGAAAVLDRTVDYIRTREQFGRSIASFQAAQHHIANLRIALDAARLTASQAVWWLGQGVPATRATAIAKMHCSEAYKSTTWTAHQLHGGIGYVRETDLHLWSERAKVTEIQGGTADIAAGWLQRELGIA